MQEELKAYHRLLVVTYRRYLLADLLLASAIDDMRAFFPPERKPSRGTIGAPGSRIRRLHDDRDRALHRLQSAHQKFRVAKTRWVRSRKGPEETRFLTLRIE